MKTYRIVMIALIILLGGIMAIQQMVPLFSSGAAQKDQGSKPRAYSIDPSDWVDKKGALSVIDIEEATKGAGHDSGLGLQYDDGSIRTAFSYDGFYNGNYFTKEYYDDSGALKMRITPDMSPTNGIIEGYIIETIESGRPVAYIFLDEDWKEQVGQTQVYWGDSYENKRNIEFHEASPGIYLEKIQDDLGRFSFNYSLRLGGIMVGSGSSPETDDGHDKDILIRMI